MRTIATPLCTLEPLVASHAREMFRVLGDPAIYEFENAPPESEQWLAERYRRLETRTSADGTQRWLNWVVRLPGGELAGYVQATVLADATSYIAYELNSRHWRKGIGSVAVAAMLEELRRAYGVHTFVAVLKSDNYRSVGLLRRLGFAGADPELAATFQPETDERVMLKTSVLAPRG